MAKTLLLLRHAKSDWDADFADDHERPLAERGVRAARDMGRFMAAAGLVPDLVVTSTAVRAVQTLERASDAGAWSDVPRRMAPELYGAGPVDVAEVLSDLPDRVSSVLLVGHEPGWSGTVGAMAGGGDVRMPTAALARIDFDADRWIDCAPGSGTLICLIPPRTLEVVLNG